MNTKVLCAQHFVRGNPETILSTCREQWTHVLCFHATQLPDKEMVLRNGIQVPTEESIAVLLRCCGITSIDQDSLKQILNANGRSVFVHLNEVFLRANCDYHRCGAEKLRKYVHEVCPEQAQSVERQLASWKPFILQLKVPVDYFTGDDLWRNLECCPSDLLVDDVNSVDVTLESSQSIPAEYIAL